MKIVTINLDKIEQNENSRVVYKHADMAELMSSMRKDGLLQPIGVMPLPGGKYDTVWGNRRLVAARKLGWTEIQANVLPSGTQVERDFIGLIENFKRRQTSVQEDGRMFHEFTKQGLTVGEIAARLEVTKMRVETALDVYLKFPKEFRAKVVNTKGRRATGTITATDAYYVNNIKKTNALSKAQAIQLLNSVSTNKINYDQIRMIAPLMKTGVGIETALNEATQTQSVKLCIRVSKSHIARIEKKTGRSFMDLCYETLENNKTLRVIPRVAFSRNHKLSTTKFAPSKTTQ